MSSIRIRPTLVFWHRWFGLLAAVWLILMAVSGSLIAFYQEIDHALNPEIFSISHQGRSALPLEQVTEAAEKKFPGSYTEIVDFPKDENSPIVLSIASKDNAEIELPGGFNVFVDPYTAEVLGDRVFGAIVFDRKHIMDLLYQFHIDLLLGDTMIWFLGVIALLWLLDHFVSVILSFPKMSKWAKSFQIRPKARGHKLNFDLHRASGLWLFPITFVLAFSGVYFNWHEPFEVTIETFSELTPRYNEYAPELDAPLYKPDVTFEKAAEIARGVSGEDLDRVSYFPWQGLYLFRGYDKARDVDDYGRRFIAVDAQNGQVLDDTHAASGTVGDVIALWQYPLHSGRAFGLTGRIIIFISGIALTILCVTGILIWLRKFRARQHNNSRQKIPEHATK